MLRLIQCCNCPTGLLATACPGPETSREDQGAPANTALQLWVRGAPGDGSNTSKHHHSPLRADLLWSRPPPTYTGSGSPAPSATTSSQPSQEQRKLRSSAALAGHTQGTAASQANGPVPSHVQQRLLQPRNVPGQRSAQASPGMPATERAMRIQIPLTQVLCSIIIVT